MKVAIIGGGAVGLLIAAYLRETKVDTVLYTRRVEQASILIQDGLLIKKKGMIARNHIIAKPFHYGLDDEDLIIVTVKQYDLEPIIRYLVKYKIKTPILFLQNGMSHLSYLSKLSTTSIFLGIVEHGVLKTSDCSIEHSGEGQIKLSCYKGSHDKIGVIWEALDSVGFPIKVETEWYPILAKKLIVNAVINPLTALYKVRNGSLLGNQFYLHNMKALFNEIVPILNLPNEKEIWEEVITICSKTASNYSSMYMDIANKRRTEVHSILGYVLEEAEKGNISLPLSSFLYNSIKGLETFGEEIDNG